MSGAPTRAAARSITVSASSRLRRDDRGNAALDDAGLLRRDLRERVAEKIGVIERDRRDHASRAAARPHWWRRAARRGRLRAAAHRPGWRENSKKPGRGRDLEHRDRLAGIGALAFLERGGELGVATRARPPPGAAEAEALVEAHEMRRGIDMHALAGRFEHRAHERDGRALAVGAGDMDDRRQFPLRMAEPLPAGATCDRATGRSAWDAARAAARAMASIDVMSRDT